MSHKNAFFSFCWNFYLIFLQLMLIGTVSTIGEVYLLLVIFSEKESIDVLIITMSFVIVPTGLQCFSVFRCRANGPKKDKVLSILTLLFLLSALALFIYQHSTRLCMYLMPVPVVMKSLEYWENFLTVVKDLESSAKESSTSGMPDRSESVTRQCNKNAEKGSVERIRKHKDKEILFKSLGRVVVISITIIIITSCEIFPFFTEASSNELTVHGKHNPLQNITSAENHFVEHVTNITFYQTFDLKQTHEMISTITTSSPDLNPNQQANDKSKNYEECNSVRCWMLLSLFHEECHLLIGLLVLPLIFSYVAELACRLQMQIVSFSIPLVLVPVLTFILVHFACVNDGIEKAFTSLHLSVACRRDDEISILQIITGCLMLFSSLLLTRYIWKPNVERMAKSEK